MPEPTAESAAPPVPTASRRRTIFSSTLLLLVLLIGVGWWLSRPRIDPRIIGTWNVTKSGPPSTSTVLIFDGDGVGIYRHAGPPVPFNWNVDNNRLLLTPNDIPFTDRLGIMLGNVLHNRRGTPDDATFDVTSVTETAVVLDVVKADGSKANVQWGLQRAERR